MTSQREHGRSQREAASAESGPFPLAYLDFVAGHRLGAGFPGKHAHYNVAELPRAGTHAVPSRRLRPSAPDRVWGGFAAQWPAPSPVACVHSIS